jgi:hypothetical protein
MLPQNKAVFEAHGIPRWWDYGIDGSLGLTMSFELFPITPRMNGKVERLFEDISPFIETWNFYQWHGYITAMTHLEVAPGRKIVSVPMSHSKGADGKIGGFLVDRLLPWILEAKPDTAYRSLDDPTKGLDSVFGKVTGFCTLCNAAGNNSTSDYADLIQDAAWLGIGATHFDTLGYVPEDYSSVSEYIDFTADGYLYATDRDGSVVGNRGTSLAAPMISGMCALVNHFFIKAIGRSLSLGEMYRFVKAHSKDIGAPGKDTKTGWGVFILPDPKTINPYDWVDDMTIKMKIGSNVMTVDGKPIVLEQAPFIAPDTGRTLVPLRSTMEAFGFTVDWNDTTREITITK